MVVVVVGEEICSMRKEDIKLHLDNFFISITAKLLDFLNDFLSLILEMLNDIVRCRGEYFLN